MKVIARRNVRIQFFIWVQFFLSPSFFLFSQTKVIPYQELPTASGAATGSGIFFGAIMSASSVTVNFEGPLDRWIAFGFGSFMSPTDVFIYSNGKVGALHPLGWNDYYNSSNLAQGVNNDLTQNWTVISTGTVAPGQRTVTATRVLSTGDPNDVSLSFSAASLDLVWARGATPDYTIAYHGNTNRAYGISLTWLSAPTASFSTASASVCAGSSLGYSNLSTGGQNSYTWTFEGGSPATSTLTNPSVTYTLPGTYSVSLIASNAVGTSTIQQLNYVTVTPTVAPAVSIALTSGSNPMCANAPFSFSATAVNGGTSPSFQWKLNGLNVGVNNALYTNASLTSSAVITCVMLSNAACASPPSATSAAVSLTVNSTAPATASAGILSGSNPMCNGSTVVFTVAAGNGGTAPAYQWQVNGSNAGSNSTTFTASSLVNGDVVTCILSSNAPCASSTLATSAGITMTVSSTFVPSVSIGISAGSNPVCANTVLTFSAIAQNGGAAPGFQWLVNGANAGINTPTFTYMALVNGDVINCVMNSNLGCASPPTASAAAVVLTVMPAPLSPVITAQGSATFCAGGNVVLESSLPSGNIWPGGITTPTLLVTGSGNYTAVIQGTNGCSSLPSNVIPVLVNPLPVVSLGAIPDLCVSSGSVILNQGLPAGGVYGGGTYVNDPAFFPDLSGTGSFTVSYFYVDANGCSNTAYGPVLVDLCTGITAYEPVDAVVKLYPNPTYGNIYVTSDLSMDHIRVTDINGKIVLEKDVADQTGIMLELAAKPGVYYMGVLLKNGQVAHLRFIKAD